MVDTLNLNVCAGRLARTMEALEQFVKDNQELPVFTANLVAGLQRDVARCHRDLKSIITLIVTGVQDRADNFVFDDDYIDEWAKCYRDVEGGEF